MDRIKAGLLKEGHSYLMIGATLGDPADVYRDLGSASLEELVRAKRLARLNKNEDARIIIQDRIDFLHREAQQARTILKDTK